MATIYVDGQPCEADGDDNLLQACLGLGLNLPYFCWHPAMGSVGACRQCAVKQFRDENDTRGKLVMACMTPAADGTRIAIEDPEARAFRKSVIEWLMTNHPHDCPVCEEGGECHLQDMTCMTGHDYRRYRFRKRTFHNQYLGPFVQHEMNRCIACYRCVRFYRDYAGGRDLHALAAHNHVYFGRHEEGVLESEFSGNLVEVCPTGVFTDKTLSRFYTRKWDLQSAPSVCVHCSLGCNTHPGERYGRLKRIVNRYNGEVNGYFICDRGRFGYDFVNSDRRVRTPLLRTTRDLQPATPDAVLQQLAPLFASGRGVIGIGSPRASLEANFALRTLVGPEHFHLGMSATEYRLLALVADILRRAPFRTPSLREAEQADAVLVLGEDIPNAAPRLALALRQAVRGRAFEIADAMRIPRWQDASVRDAAQDERSPLFVASLVGTRLDDTAAGTYRMAPDDIARLGFAVAHEIDNSAPAVPDLSDDVRALAAAIARSLKDAQRPLVVSGTGCHSAAVIEAAADVALALHRAQRPVGLCLVLPECNSLGLTLMGGRSLEAAMTAVRSGTADTVVVLENDLYRRADRAQVDALLGSAGHVLVIDHLMHDTAARARIVLPAGTFAEADGTLVSSEGRAQRFFQVFVPRDGVRIQEVRESWRWLRDIMSAAGRSEVLDWSGLDDVTAACAAALPELEGITRAAPSSRFRIAGQKVARQPHRYSGRTAMSAHVTVHEPTPPDDPDAPLNFSMEGYQGKPPPALIPLFWAPGWNSIQSVNKFQAEIGEQLAGGDPGVRLIEPRAGMGLGFFGGEGEPPRGAGGMPSAFLQRQGEWLLAPLHHVFGSEELSALAPAIVERMPPPYLALNASDAMELRLAGGQQVTLALDETEYRLPVQSRPDLPRGLVGVPVGLPGFEGIVVNRWGRLRP
jgi:NADH-quinone oxidoreductase subunit G